MGIGWRGSVACVGAALVLGAGTKHATAQSTEARVLAERFGAEDWEGRPGCAVASFRSGEIDYFGAFGMSNLEFAVPIGRNTVFNIGSVTKQFTAYSVALLVDRGAVKLDDDIRDYLPWVPDYGTPITIRHLLNHTSGLRDYVTLKQLKGIPEDAPWSDEEARALLSEQTALNYTPGEEYQYSNSGYFVLAQLVEAVSGTTLGEFARGAIFEPLGMVSTGFIDDHTAVVPGRADAYAPDGHGNYVRAAWNTDAVGAGGLLTTIEDMARWDSNLARNRLGLSEELVRLLVTGPTFSDGRSSSYGFGLMTPVVRGIQLVGHNGSSAGYNAVYMRAPEHDIAAIALCNATDAQAGRYIQPILDTYLDRYMDPAPAGGMSGMGAPAATPPPPELPTPTEAAALHGRYFSEELDETYQIAAEGDGITFTRVAPNGASYTLMPASRGLYRSTDRSFTIRFVGEGDSTRALLTTRSGRVRDLAFVRAPGG